MTDAEAKNGQPPDILERYPLDETTAGLLRELRQQILFLEAQSRGVLALFCRIHSLPGVWQVGNDLKEAVQVEKP